MLQPAAQHGVPWDLASASEERLILATRSCRRLLVFPKGNKQNDPNVQEFLAIYLDAPEAAWTPPHLNPKAIFKLTLHHPNDQGASMVKGGPLQLLAHPHT